MFRAFLAVALAVAVFVAAKDGRLLRETGVLGSCRPVDAQAAVAGQWWACEEGALGGRPDLADRGCVRIERTGRVEYWSCPPGAG